MPSPFDRLAYSVSARSRAQKWAQFLALVRPGAEETIVDIGVNTTEYSETDNYLERVYPHPERITALGVGMDFALFRKRYPSVTTVAGDGTQLPFANDQFDIAYSNAVIEHVGNREQQLSFLREMYRVAGRGYLTTPNRTFPIEVHTRIPLLHLLLPKAGFDRVATFLGKGWAAGDYMRLLDEQELRALLTTAGITEYSLLKNRLFGFPMTFTVVWNKKLRS
jgi:SAM-dependent methyltransferase